MASAVALLLPAHVAAHTEEVLLHRQQTGQNRLNDLLGLGRGGGQPVSTAPVAKREEPALEATPRARCDNDSRPEPEIQGRVPAGAAANGLRCNLEEIGHHGNSGGFRVHRYVDERGRECAYYDTALLLPVNALKLSGDSLGVVVLDMSHPARPLQTDTLSTPPMVSPHESLNVNQKRGLIAAVTGNPAFGPGLVSIFDASRDCRHPVHKATAPVVTFGHESGFARDGRTFYVTGAGASSVAAIDLTDPSDPRNLWQGDYLSHGMELSDDGNRAYIADAVDGEFAILDTSEIQAREPRPRVREISRLTWASGSIPQNAFPFTSGGTQYVLEIDEYNKAASGSGDPDQVGAARIIDISDERAPRVISNIRLQVHQPADHAAAGNDPGAQSPVQGYAAHYCSLPARLDPQVVACSMIVSGLRVFDISDVAKPKEIAYHVGATQPRGENGFMASAFAMSMPTIVADRREVWYSDGTSGFYVLRVDEHAWPKARAACKSRRRFTAHVRLARGARVRSVRATLGGRRVRAVSRGRVVRVTVDLRGRGPSRVRLVVHVRLRDGRTITTRRTYRPCTRRAA